jgi:hypothetical protein
MKTKLLCWFGGVLLLAATTARAQNSWIDGSGKWETTNDWSFGAAPGGAEAIFITNAATKTVTIDATTSTSHVSTLTIGHLFLSGLPGATNTLRLANAGLATPLSISAFGEIHTNGALVIFNSAVNVGFGLQRDDGLITVDLGYLFTTNASDGLTIGSGEFDLNSGTVSVNQVEVGYDANTTNGVFRVNGGTCIVNGAFNVFFGGNVWVNGGELVVSNGENLVLGSLGSTATMTVSNGLVNLSSQVIQVGTGGNGTLTIAGGTVLADLDVGGAGSTGTVWMTGGQVLSTNHDQFVLLGDGGRATMIVSNGTVMTDRLLVSTNTATPGELDVLGGSFTVLSPSASSFLVGGGNGSTGTVNVIGASLTATNGTIIIGGGSNSVASVTISNGSAMTGETDLGTGTNSQGMLVISSNGVMNVLSNMTAGTGSGSFALIMVTGNSSLTITNGTLGIGSDGVCGGSGFAQMTVQNASVMANGILLGSSVGGHGIMTIKSGGALHIPSALPGCAACGLNLNDGILDGGTIDAPGAPMYAGRCHPGEFIISNGVASVLQFHVGLDSAGTYTHVGGTVNVFSNLVVGSGAGVTGVVNITGGALLVTNSTGSSGIIGIGNDGTATGGSGTGQMTIQNASVTANGILLGSSVGGHGIMTIKSGGALHIPSALPGCAACGLQYNEGILDGGAIDSPGAPFYAGQTHPGEFDVTNGTGYFLSGYVGFDNPGTMSIVGGSVNIYSNLVVGDCGAGVTGSVTITGGSLYVTNATQNAVLDIRDGTFTLAGGGALVQADRLMMSNACATFVFNAGELAATTGVFSNGQTFVVGDGSDFAILFMNGGINSFGAGLHIAGNSQLYGSGTINGSVLIDPNANVQAGFSPGLDFNGAVTNNGFIFTFSGTAVNFHGLMVNNGTIDARNGDAEFLGGLINNGTILTNFYANVSENTTNTTALTPIGSNGFAVALLGYPLQSRSQLQFFADNLDGAAISDASTPPEPDMIQFYAASVDDASAGPTANIAGFRVLQSLATPNQMTVYRSWVASIQTNNVVAPDSGIGSGCAGSFGMGSVAKDGTIVARVDGTSAPTSPSMIGEGVFKLPPQVSHTIIVTNGIENDSLVLALDSNSGDLPQIGQNADLVAKNSFGNFSYVCRSDINPGNAGAAAFSSNGQVIVSSPFNARGTMAHNDTAKMFATFVKTPQDLAAGGDATTGLAVMKYADAGGPISLLSVATNVFGSSSPAQITTNAQNYFSRTSFSGPAQISINDSGAVAFAVSLNVDNANDTTNGTRAAQVTGILYQPQNSTNFLLVTDNTDSNLFWISPNDCTKKNLISSVALDNYNNVYFMAAYAGDTNFPCDFFPFNALYEAVANNATNPTAWSVRILMKEDDTFTNLVTGDVFQVYELPYAGSVSAKSIISRSLGPNAINRVQLPGHNSANTQPGDAFSVGGLLVQATLTNLTQNVRTDALLYVAPYSSAAPVSATNSWLGGNGKWETAAGWSLNAVPSTADLAEIITNAGLNTVTIDATTAGGFPSTMTISNLVMAGATIPANTLALSNAGTNNPLHILGNLSVTSAGGAIIITNSALRIDGGSFVRNDGSLILNSGLLDLGTNELRLATATVGFIGGNLYINGGIASMGTLTLSTAGGQTAVATIGGGLLNVSGAIRVGPVGSGILTINGGSVAVTNPTQTAVLDVEIGTLTMNSSGVVVADHLSAINVIGRLNLNNGTLNSRGTAVSNAVTFFVGDATNPAVYHLLGGVHSFANGLEVRNNASLSGCGMINGSLTVDTGGTVLADCGGTLTFTGILTNNGLMQASNGSVLEAYGLVVNNGTIDITGGTTNFHGGFVNHGTVLTPVPLQITGITKQGNDIRIDWQQPSGSSNALQATAGTANGSYGTNNFTDLFAVTNATGTTTNYVETGGATNKPARYYRVRLVP